MIILIYLSLLCSDLSKTVIVFMNNIFHYRCRVPTQQSSANSIIFDCIIFVRQFHISWSLKVKSGTSPSALPIMD